MTEAVVYVEYEVPPCRGISWVMLKDFGYSEADLRAAIAEEHPSWNIRKIEYREVELEDEPG